MVKKILKKYNLVILFFNPTWPITDLDLDIIELSGIKLSRLKQNSGIYRVSKVLNKSDLVTSY